MGHAPEAMGHAPVVGVMQGRRLGDHRGHQGPEAALRVREHQEDRAEVRASGEEQLEAVLLGGGAGALVGQDHALLRVLGPESREHAEAPQGAPLGREGLLEDVERRLGIRREEPLLAPSPERLPRLAVGVVARPAIQDHADDVPGVARVQLLLVGGWDHVVGRGQDAGQVLFGNAVENAGERLDLGQGKQSTTTCHDNEGGEEQQAASEAEFTSAERAGVRGGATTAPPAQLRRCSCSRSCRPGPRTPPGSRPRW